MITDSDISNAQNKLGIKFHSNYIDFIKTGYFLGDSILEPLEIVNNNPHLDIYNHCKIAWTIKKIDKNLIPIVYDNADYYCLNEMGGIEFWSHDTRSVTEKWNSVKEWVDAMINEAK